MSFCFHNYKLLLTFPWQVVNVCILIRKTFVRFKSVISTDLVSKLHCLCITYWQLKLKQFSVNIIHCSHCFFKNGPIPASFCLFLFFSCSNFNTNWKKHRWCAWDSKPGPQDGRCRQNHGAMAATPDSHEFGCRSDLTHLNQKWWAMVPNTDHWIMQSLYTTSLSFFSWDVGW